MKKLKNGEKNNSILGLIFIYWIGKYFYQLAEEFNKNKWLFAILGVVVYYAAQLIVGVLIGVLAMFFNWNIDFESNIQMALIGIPAGAGITYLFYFLLERKWKSEKIEVKDSIQDIGKVELD